MERCIEYTDLRYIRQYGRDGVYAFQVSGIVKRSQVVASRESIQDFLCQQHRFAELLTTMHHTMTYCVDFIQRFDSAIFRAG